MKHDIKSIKPLKDLNLTDRFLFDMVMEDLQTQQDVLSIIFGRNIPLLSQGGDRKRIPCFSICSIHPYGRVLHG
nr:hypothetical protein [Lachnoclostridium sp. An196]